jgi:hypothetical protein
MAQPLTPAARDHLVRRWFARADFPLPQGAAAHAFRHTVAMHPVGRGRGCQRGPGAARPRLAQLEPDLHPHPLRDPASSKSRPCSTRPAVGCKRLRPGGSAWTPAGISRSPVRRAASRSVGPVRACTPHLALRWAGKGSVGLPAPRRMSGSWERAPPRGTALTEAFIWAARMRGSPYRSASRTSPLCCQVLGRAGLLRRYECGPVLAGVKVGPARVRGADPGGAPPNGSCRVGRRADSAPVAAGGMSTRSTGHWMPRSRQCPRRS